MIDQKQSAIYLAERSHLAINSDESSVIVRRAHFEIDKKFHVEQLTGETQVRARRTRVKILRAIADKNGVSGFSDIKVFTGLSTGSIYCHLDRMGTYVTKDSKHYMITEEGLQFLRETDTKYSGLIPPKREEQAQPDFDRFEETVRQAH